MAGEFTLNDYSLSNQQRVKFHCNSHSLRERRTIQVMKRKHMLAGRG